MVVVSVAAMISITIAIAPLIFSASGTQVAVKCVSGPVFRGAKSFAVRAADCDAGRIHYYSVGFPVSVHVNKCRGDRAIIRLANPDSGRQKPSAIRETDGNLIGIHHD